MSNMKVIMIERNSINQKCFDKIKPYLEDITNNLENSDTWKIQLTIAIIFISFKDTNEERVTNSKSYNIEITKHNAGYVLNNFLTDIKLG